MTDEIKVEQERPGLPHTQAGQRVDGIRLDWSGVLVSTRDFLSGTYGSCELEYEPSCASVFARRTCGCVRGGMEARYCRPIFASCSTRGRNDLRAPALVIRWSDWEHRVCRGRGVRARSRRGRQLKGIRWYGRSVGVSVAETDH